jgi:hypothetical protein
VAGSDDRFDARRDDWSDAQVLAETRAWVDRAVIGLNLCPFAKAPQVKGQLRYVVTHAQDAEALLADLITELQLLAQIDPEQTDTTLLVHPAVLTDFLDFNDFLGLADAALEDLQLDGVLQIASFHPHYQFAGTAADDVDNATNRSPYPTLHLIREASLDRAVAAIPQAASIFDANIATLRALGAEGWRALQAQCRRDAQAATPAQPPQGPEA